MELSVIEEGKHKLKLAVAGETHTFCNLIRKELWNDEHTKVSGYNIHHSLVGQPILIVETDEKADPRKVLQKAVSRLEKNNKDLRDLFKKAIK